MTKRGKLPLDDPCWLPIVEAHKRLCELIGDTQLAARELTEAMARERNGVRSMRRSIYDADPDRELLPPSHWGKYQLWSRLEYTMAGAPGQPLVVRSRDRSDPKGPDGDIGPSYSYAYYVWRPDLEKLWPPPSPSERASEPPERGTDDVSPRRRPGKPPKHDWPTVVARELIRRVKANEPDPTAAQMCQWCFNKWRWQPDIRAMQRLLKQLLT